MFKRISAIAVAAIWMIGVGHAVVLDFEGFGDGQIIDDEYTGVTISAVNNWFDVDHAIIYDTRGAIGEDPDLEGDFTNVGATTPTAPASLDAGNVLIIAEGDQTCSALTCPRPDDEGRRPAGELRFAFANEVTINSLKYMDIENIGELPFQIDFYSDAMFTSWIVGSTIQPPDTNGDNRYREAIIGQSGVRGMIVSLRGSGALDDISFTVVPIPAALPLFGTALAGMGFIGWRRKRQAA